MNARVVGLLGLALLRLAPPAVAQDGSTAATIPASLAHRIAPAVRYESPPVDPAGDGYVPLRLAADLVRGPALSAQGSAVASPLSQAEREALASNGLSLWLFDQARDRPAFRWPPFQVGDESFHRLRQVLLLALLRARQESEGGSPARAAADLSATLALAQRMAGGESQLIHLLATLGLQRRILEQIAALAGAGALSQESLQDLAATVDAGPTPCELYARAWRVEFNTYWVPAALDAERRGEWHGPPVGDAIERASGELAAHFADCGSPQAFPCGAPIAEVDFAPGVYDQAVWRWGAQRAATETILALRLYQARFGRLPDDLDELVRSHIRQAVPRDPFTASPVGYDPARPGVWLDVPPSLQACGGAEARGRERLEWPL